VCVCVCVRVCVCEGGYRSKLPRLRGLVDPGLESRLGQEIFLLSRTSGPSYLKGVVVHICNKNQQKAHFFR
jgi:hypothetical protein